MDAMNIKKGTCTLFKIALERQYIIFSVTSCSGWTWKKGYPAVGRLSGICVDGSCVLKANGSNSDRRIFIHGEIGRDISQNQRDDTCTKGFLKGFPTGTILAPKVSPKGRSLHFRNVWDETCNLVKL
ncbi:hypothetical protein Tco_1522558 [Tanacetum coccineum]